MGDSLTGEFDITARKMSDAANMVYAIDILTDLP